MIVPILRAIALGAALALVSSGAVHAATVRDGLFSVTLPVIAILQDELFEGEAIGYIDRTGTIEIRSVRDPANKCSGTFHYTGLSTGLAEMQCEDGAREMLSFKALGPFSGYGQGGTRRGPASFTFGLDPEQAAEHLTVPPGKKLVVKGDGLRLESAAR